MIVLHEQNNLEETIDLLRKKYYRDDLTRKPETEKDYWKMFLRLSGNVINSASKNTILEAALSTRKKKTWTKRRAAILFGCFKCIDQLWGQLSTSQLSERVRLEIMIWNIVRIIQAIPDGCPVKNIVKNHSKKVVVRHLANDWREQMIEHIDPKYQLDLILLSLTGCRPAELASGIDVLVSSDRKLYVTIKTAKVKDGKIVIKDKIYQENTKLVAYQAGQERRTLIYDLDQNNYFLNKLVDLLLKTNDERDPKPEPDKSFRVNLHIFNPKTLASSITRLGEKLFPAITENITPYCFRHQLAVDLKSAGVDGDEISMMLGHAVDTMKEKYGFISRTKGARENIPNGVKTIMRLNNPSSINQVKKCRNRKMNNTSKLRKRHRP